MKMLGKIWWMPLLVYIIVVPALMSARVDSIPCRKIDIRVSDSLDYRFVTRSRIFNIVQSDTRNILGKRSAEIDSRKIEKDIDAINELERAEVYYTIDGVLHVEADQRDPVLRLITRYGKSYYIDSHDMIIPHSRVFTPRVIVVSGYIDIPPENLASRSLVTMSPDSDIRRVVEFVEYINGDPFWSGQVEQVWINPQGEPEIVPRMGNHIIRFGTLDDYRGKLSHLEVFYREVMPEVGWNSYREINLRYDGQIVCKKR
ncbi:MAG: hypothetical protein R2744_09580 [Bacteroidales bacterium]